MGVMNLFNRNREEKMMEKQTKQEMEFTRERDNFNAGNAQSDETYYNVLEARSDLLKWQQDLNDEVEKLKHRLKSEVLTDKGWVPKLDRSGSPIPPLANDRFIEYIETQVEPFLSRNLFNSNYEEKRILLILRVTCDDIADAMVDNYDEYDIQFTNFDLVFRLVKNCITPGPYRALNDGQRRHDRSIIKGIEVLNQQQEQPKKGLFGIMNS